MKSLKELNPIEDFYEEQKLYNTLHSFLSEKYIAEYCLEDGTIVIKPKKDLKEIFDKKNVDLIMGRIMGYLTNIKRDTEDSVLKKYKEVLERKRERVRKDFDLKEVK